MAKIMEYKDIYNFNERFKSIEIWEQNVDNKFIS